VGVENLDGGVKDRDLFVLGDEDEDDDDDDLSMDEGRQGHRSAAPPPPDAITTVSPLLETPSPPPPVTDNREDVPVTNPTTTPPISSDGQQPYKPGVPSVYRLRRGDTLMGIALRFRLDVRFFHGSRRLIPFPSIHSNRSYDQAVELCRLNDLPTTTLSTTPHILHTRTTILLSPTSMPPTEDPTIVEARRVERAEKRLQMVTKEVDWRVAKAYVAIVQDSDPSGVPAKEKSDDYRRKVPVSGLEGSPSQRGALENGAIDRYLEDAEWEEQERKEGRGPAIQRFPWGSFGQKLGLSPGGQQGTDGFKWPWNA